VLDEPTAHLDSATATSLLDDVLDTAGDASVLLITHRRERLERMDQVVVLPG
jgi:ABC-type transport system involved in cytochrome bd biosynthesis fused ATPase/permease subunit